jgi:hypothetical protein
MRARTIIAGSLLALFGLAGCDDDNGSQQQLLGGGPGSAATPADATNVAGPCSPVGGVEALGTPSYTSNSTAKIDTDGDPNAQGHDATWQPQTKGGVNAGTYAFVVMSQTQMFENNVSIGDWALVTNNQTGQQTWARVEDVGPEGGEGEISEAAASQIGIQYTPDSFTVGNPSVTVQAYAQTASIESNCNQLATANP